ncbi:MAG: hypothetical protein L0220_16160 [Acidobacteria bacterium]|nr:hypothetical protein [Acidobacteriota bacterium]
MLSQRFHEYLADAGYAVWGAVAGHVFAVALSPEAVNAIYQVGGGLVTAVLSGVVVHFLKKYLKSLDREDK